MKRIMKRVLCLFVAMILCLGSFSSLQAQAEEVVPVVDDERVQTGHIKVTDFYTGEKHDYKAILLDEETIYMSAESLESMSGYQVSGEEHGSVTFQLPGRKEEAAIHVDASGMVSINSEITYIDMIDYKDTFYYHANQMLNLLGGQWFQYPDRTQSEDDYENGYLLYLPERLNTLDFVGETRKELHSSQITQKELVKEGGSDWGQAFASGMAVVFNDFDMRILIPFVGDDMIIGDQYKEAMETLSVDDSQFVTEGSLSEISELVQESDFGEMTFQLHAMEDILDLPDNIIATVEGGQDVMEIIRDSKFGLKLLGMVKDESAVLDKADLGAWSSVLGKVNTAADVVNVFVSAYKTWERGSSWSSEHIEQLAVLQDLQSPGNESVVKYVNLAANILILETKWPTGAALLGETVGLLGIVAGNAVKLTPLGPIIGIISAGVAIGKTFPEFKRGIESDDLKYMVNCLIKIEALALSEADHAYNQCMTRYKQGTLDKTDLNDLKNKYLLAIRTNLRNSAMVYYLKAQENSAWTSSDDAARLIRQMVHDYAFLTEIEYASDWDDLVRCSNWKSRMNSVGTVPGDIRDAFDKRIWYPDEGSKGNATYYVEYHGKVYFWGFTSGNFEPSGTWGTYYPIAGVETKLMAVDANDPQAQPEVILTADGTGKIGIWNDRLYYESRDSQNQYCIKSIMLDGTDAKTHSGLYSMLDADDENGVLICSDSSFRGVNLLDMTTGESTSLVSEGNFILVEDGIAYYYESTSRQSINVCASTTDGKERYVLGSVTQTLWTEKEMSTMGSTGVESAQIADGYLYICYGSRAGTGNIFQGGEIARFLITDLENPTGAEPVYGSLEDSTEDEIYVQSVEEAHTVYFVHTNKSDYHLEPVSMPFPGGSPTVSQGSEPHPKGEIYLSNWTAMCVHPDFSGTVQTLITTADLSSVVTTEKINAYLTDVPLVEVQNVTILGDWVYYTVEKGYYSDNLGWRNDYTREWGVIFRKNLQTGTIQQLHTY